MLGTLVNVAAIVAAGLLGCLVKKGLPKSLENSLMKAIGLVVFIIGLNGVLTNMLSADETGKLSDSGTLLLLVSLALGVIAGELLKLDDRLNGLGRLAEEKLHLQGFAKGFVPASLIFVIGAMGIVGALNDGLRGDSNVLFVKSTLDFVTGTVLASSLGIGVAFAAVPVLLWQGGISLAAGALAPLLSDLLLQEICMVGYAMVMALGLNFLCETKIKIANLLPGLLVPVFYELIQTIPFS